MEDRLRRLMVFGVGVEINARDEVAELVRRHMDPDVLLDRFDDLLRHVWTAPLDQGFSWRSVNISGAVMSSAC